MAGKSDGSITIDTKLDNTGFSKGSNELKRAVRSLTNQVNETGSQIRNAFKFDFGQPKQAVNSFSRAIKQVNEEINSLGELGKKAIEGDEEALARFRTESGETLSKLEEMKEELNNFGSTEFETPEHQKIAEQYAKAAADVDSLTKSLEEAEGAFETLTNDFGRSDEYMELEDKIEVLRMWKEEYDDAVKRGDVGAQANAMLESGVGKGSIADALKEAEAEMDKMWEKFENSSPYRKAQGEIDKITEKLEQAKQTAIQYKEQLANTPATFEGYESTEYEKDHEALEKTIDRLLEYRRLVREGVQNPGSVDTSQFDVIQQKMRQVIDLGTPMANALKKAFSAIVTGAKNAAVHLAGMVKNGVISGLKKLGNAISNVGKHSKKSNVSLGTSFKTMLKYGLGIRSLFVLFNKLRRALIDGFTALSQYDTELNGQITAFKASLTTLKNSFAAAFAPIAKIVLPIITSLINGLSEAISKVGQLVAALTGKTSFMKAVTAQNNTAASADNASNSMQNETKSAKELQRTLAGFDDVEILQDKSSSLDKGQTAGTSFVETPIDNNFADLANKIKEAWKNADFTEIGRMIGEKLKNALESIPWDKIKATLRKIAKSIATLLNGFLETPGLFTVIGKTIAEGINSAFEFVESFVSNFHWASLGKAIKDLILGVLNNLDWDLIYRTMAELGAGIGTALENALNDAELWSKIFTAFANGLRALVSSIRAFLGAVNWAELGTNISNGLKDGMNAIPWDEIYALAGDFGKDLADFLNGLFTEDTFSALGETVAEFLNTALEFLNVFGETFDFSGFGKSLAAGLNSFFKKFNTLRLIGGIIKLVTGIRDTIVTFLGGVNWYEFGTKLRDIIKKLPWKLILLSFGKVIWEAINSAIKLFMGLFDTDNVTSPLTNALTDLQTTVDGISEKIDFDTLSKGIGDLVTALKPAVAGFAAGLLEVFNGLLEIGIAFIQKLGPAFQAIADAINSLPEGTVSKFGEDLGKVAASLVIMKGASTVITTLGGLVSKMTAFGAAGAAAAEGGAAAASGASSVATAAGSAATGVAGFLSKLGLSAGVTAVFQDAINKHVIRHLDGTAQATEEADKGFGCIRAALYETGLAGDTFGLKMNGVEAPMFHLAFDSAPDFATAFGEVAQNFEDAGGDVDAFKESLKKMLSEGAFNESQAAVIKGYISDIGSSADTASTQTGKATAAIEDLGDKSETADTNTGGISDALDALNGLSLTTPLKLALIAGAIKALGDKGLLSQGQVEDMQKVLDEYDPKKPEESMAKIAKAFDDAGISGDDFAKNLPDAVKKADKDVQPELKKILGGIDTFAATMKTKGKTSGENLGDGTISGIESKEEDIQREGEAFVESGVEGMENAGQMHSPSRVTMLLGQYLGEGLRLGLNSKKSSITTLAGSIITAVKTTIDGYKTQFQTSGTNLFSSLQTGISNMSNSLSTTAYNIMVGMWNSAIKLSWWNMGKNIATGIYNGLFAHAKWLSTLAWNTAVNMYNSACKALGISSPSKEFKWIGEMITEGLGGGIEATQDNAVDAVTSLADAVTKEAENADPSMVIDTSVSNATDGLDNVLSGFSDKVIKSFDSMIAAMEDIVNGSAFTMPAIASGSVMPYSARRAAAQDQGESLSAIADAIALRDADRLTRDDLSEVLINVLRQYLNIDFYIGDEQIARHANAGNMKLGRRYSATTT